MVTSKVIDEYLLKEIRDRYQEAVAANTPEYVQRTYHDGYPSDKMYHSWLDLQRLLEEIDK